MVTLGALDKNLGGKKTFLTPHDLGGGQLGHFPDHLLTEISFVQD